MKSVTEDHSVNLSPSLESLSVEDRATSQQITGQLFEMHPEYANGLARSIKLVPTSVSNTKEEWLQQVIALFNWDAIANRSKEKSIPPTLHGRLMIIGLALIDNELKKQLDEYKIFDALVKELQEPIIEILSPSGLNLLNTGTDSVPNQSDEPVIDINKDLLGRAAFARFLAKRITTTERSQGASIHLCGPWGSGKTTILNFLKSELKNSKAELPSKNGKTEKRRKVKNWTVVDFNAWRNQHISPPWWPLYSQIYEESKKTLGFWYSFKEFLWRLLTGQPFHLLVIIIVFWLIVLMFNLLGTDLDQNAWAGTAKNLSEIIALVSTVAGAILGFGRSLLFSSAKAAQSFQDYSHDPMQKIQDRFGKLAKKLNKRSRLAVIIDDLDRCKSNYVVALLEGIQTLFRQGSVFFIVAADNKWLQACFELVYAEFKSTIDKPGKPLGVLFIEKTFQLTTPVPSIPKDFKAAYWNQLIMVKSESINKEIETVRKKALDDVQKGTSDMEVYKIVEKSKTLPMYEQLAIREEAVVHIASPEVLARTEHTLQPFVSLLDDNPRAMKRLVNAYSVNRARAILAFLNIETDDLAQWTILNIRWPHLTEYLKDNPESIHQIGNENPENIDIEIKYLFTEPEVINVVNGGDITSALTVEVLVTCSKLL